MKKFPKILWLSSMEAPKGMGSPRGRLILTDREALEFRCVQGHPLQHAHCNARGHGLSKGKTFLGADCRERMIFERS